MHHQVMQLVVGQVDEAGKVAEGLTKNPLAWMVVLLLGAVVFLTKQVISGYEARITLMEKMYAQLLETHTGTVTLGLKYAEGLDVLDKAIDKFTNNREE